MVLKLFLSTLTQVPLTHSLDRSGAGLDTGKRELVRLALEGIHTSVWIRDRHSDQFHTVVGKVSATLKLE